MKRLFFIISLLSITNADLIQPTNYNALYHTYVQFEWEQIPSTNRYQLMVSNNDSFTDVIINVTDLTLVYIDRENIEWNSQYYWKIRKHNLDGELGSWSDVFTFTTAQQKSNVTTTFSNESEIADGVTIFGSFFNYYSAVVDNNGNEIWNSGIEDLVFIILMMKVIYLVVI